jgi:uncharacterized small protein (DUF1192 family)
MFIDAADSNDVRCVQEVDHHIQLLIEAIDRNTFDIAHPEKESKKENFEFRQYIKIFNNRYLQHVGNEYYKTVDGSDQKIIIKLIESLKAKNASYTEYLEWLFDSFLTDPKNATFNPPSIRATASQYIFDKYTYEHKDKIQMNKEEEKEKIERTDLYNRARALHRETNDDKIKEWVKDYKEGTIDIVELRNNILRAEAELAEKKDGNK